MKKFKLFSYDPPKKGVQKDDERASVQTDFFGFFTMYGRKFWNLSNLNILIAVYILILSLGVWKLAAYPVVFYIFLGVCALAFGIVNTGAAYVVRGYVRGDPVYILSDFRYAVKHNFVQGMILGVIDLAVVLLLVFDLLFWSGMDLNYLTSYTEAITENTQTEIAPNTDADDGLSGVSFDDGRNSDKDNAAVPADSSVLSESADSENPANSAEPVPQTKERTFWDGVFFYTCIFLIFLYGFMRNYMYLILVTFKLSIFKILKNSFIFAFLGIKRNLAALLGIVVVCFINVYLFVWIPLVGLTLPLIITTSTLFFIGAYAAYPVIKKYMITPYYKDEEVYEEYDKIFEDRG